MCLALILKTISIKKKKKKKKRKKETLRNLKCRLFTERSWHEKVTCYIILTACHCEKKKVTIKLGE
jgi:hypothetical protein